MVVRIELLVLEDETTEHVVVIPHNLRQTLEVSAPTVQFSVGQSTAVARVEPGCSKGRLSKIHLSRSLFLALHLRESLHLCVWRDKAGGGVRIGPVLGILVGGQSNKSLGVHVEIVRDCLRLASRQGAMAYAFGASDIDWERGSVAGWVYHQGGVARVDCPLPDVVYDKVSSRRVEKNGAVVKMKERLLGYPRLKYYNRSFFNKWEVHRILSGHVKLRRYLPSTGELSAEKMLEYLRQYQSVFVKPAEGSLGVGILRVVRVGSVYGYRLTRFNRPDLRGNTCSSEKILRTVRVLMRQGQYIVQRGIRLARVNGCPFDVRILLQKNGRNQWFVASTVARVAQPGNIISNIADGATTMSPRQAIMSALGLRAGAGRQVKIMSIVAKKVARAIERGMDMEFAEMGVDLAIDIHGKIWILEANSRPGRQTNDLPTKLVAGSVVKLVKFLCSRGLR
ncbi:MAG: YheC/YheD family protein [Peptococcaceae bacterium]|nr:YheC/YheD family protein [Peptococcaceae bacterium]